MRRMIIAIFLVCMIVFGKTQKAFSEETGAASLNNSVNLSGLTGLLRTASAETVGSGQVALGASGEFEDSRTPSFRRYTIRGTVTVGVTRGAELALMFPYLRQSGENGPGDLEIAGKWRILAKENFPALAVAASVITPTGSESKGFSIVHNYGFTFKGIGSAIVGLPSLNDYAFGVFAEAGLFFRDLGRPQEEKHAFYGAGLLLPIEFLQLVLEINGTLKDQSTPAKNVVIFTPGLRYVTRNFSLSAGYEYTAKEAAGYRNTHGALLSASITF
jgi:hypothetical protein